MCSPLGRLQLVSINVIESSQMRSQVRRLAMSEAQCGTVAPLFVHFRSDINGLTGLNKDREA